VSDRSDTCAHSISVQHPRAFRMNTTISSAVAVSNMESLNAACKNQWDMQISIHSAIAIGDMEFLKDACKNGWNMPDDYTSFYKAVNTKQFGILMWMIEEGYYGWTNEPLDDIAAAGAEIGRIDIMEWALDMGWDMDSFTFMAAAAAKQIDALEFMRKNGYDVTVHMWDEWDPVVTEWLKNCA
jgi:hypothetical protein